MILLVKSFQIFQQALPTPLSFIKTCKQCVLLISANGENWNLKNREFSLKFSNRFFSKGRILDIYFLMNLPSANRLWSETSGITSVFCRGYLMTDSNGVNR